MWFLSKKSTDQALRDLVGSLSGVLGENILSVLVFGSKASGEYREESSDVNVFILLEDVSWDVLGMLVKPVRVWMRGGNPLPVLIQKSELQIYATNLPIEFLDMQDYHTVLFGSDPLQRLIVSRAHLQAQCAQELSVKQLKLRQAVLLANGNDGRIRDILLDSLPSVLTLYRAALRLEKDVPKGSKIDAAKELSKLAGFDQDCLEQLWGMHLRRQSDNVGDLAKHYLESLERVLAYVSRK